MYLSKLELFGFKSFAQKTKLAFNEGISCVIGPNGSGKSNIVDAIRWVLGEQRVSTLGSDKMENIIFNGTKTRKSLGMTEVSLTIHNNKEILDSAFSEVVVSRRLYRSGESQYLLNKTPCRLKDIVDLFMDTGMGANSYSVIELKMVESIVSDNPAERRHLFEEAAGITKYKVRRKSALRKLEMTRQDMSRISDLITEIQRTVNSLSRQVGKARRYLKFKNELKQTDIELAKFKYARYFDEINPLKQQLEEISLIKDDASQQITLEEALLEEYKRELIQTEQNLQGFNKKIQQQDAKINQIKEDEAVSKTRMQALKETRVRYESDLKEFTEKAENLKLDLDKYSDLLRKSEISVNEIEKKHTAKELQLHSAENILLNDKQNVENLNSELVKQREQLLAQKENVQQINYQLAWNNEQLVKFEQEKNQQKYSDSTLSGELNALVKEAENLRNQKEEINKKIESEEKKLNQFKSEKETLIEKIQALETKREKMKTRIEFFEQIISKYEGHHKSTQFIMSNFKNNPGLLGPLSDLVKVDSEYKKALETALGDALNYIVVKNVSTAKNFLNAIENKKLGKVSLLPLDRIEQININESDTETPFPLLSDLVSCDKEYKKIVRLLLGDVAISESLDNALETSVNFSSYRFVTKKGESINFAQAISAGEKADGEISLIGREEQLVELKKGVEKLDSTITKSKESELELHAKIQDIVNSLKDNQIIKDQLSEKIIEKDKKTAEINFQKKSLVEAMSNRSANEQDIKKFIVEAESKISVLNNDISQQQKILDEFEQKTILAENTFSKKNQETELLQKEAQKLQLELIQKQNHFTNAKNDLERTNVNVSEIKELIAKRQNEIKQIGIDLSEIERMFTERSQNQKKIWEERDSIETERESIQDLYHELKDKIIHLEDQIKKFRKQHDSSLERTRQLELNIQENQMKADNIKERIKSEYGEDITVGIAYDGLDIETHIRKIESLKFKINQLGQVNPLAVSEYDKESERLEFFTKQFNDLTEAEKSLLKTINKINVTAREQFLDTFEKIKTNFENVFGNFFENGEGSLKLDDESDPLESNIEIFVRPKGKRVQTINLLSGGEKTLTAISLLFSIYLVKPSPFCILDEIDAPLDDVNISRFTEALKDFARNTQFIVVTHNKRTMESADTMYGVTMEEEGLSKLVSVKFN